MTESKLPFPVIGGAVVLFLTLSSYFSGIMGIAYGTTLGSWVSSGFEVNWIFSIDALTCIVLLVVLTVSTRVLIYSTEYMHEDPHTQYVALVICPCSLSLCYC